MNTIFMHNMHAVVEHAINARCISPVNDAPLYYASHWEVTNAYLNYLLHNGRASSRTLREKCRPNYNTPSRALHFYIKNELVIYHKARNNYALGGYYEIAPGITAKALGLET